MHISLCASFRQADQTVELPATIETVWEEGPGFASHVITTANALA